MSTQSEPTWTRVTRSCSSYHGTSFHTHSQHGSGTVMASRDTGIVTCCLVERKAPETSTSGCRPDQIKRGYSQGLSTAGSQQQNQSNHVVRGTDAVQQLNVRLRQLETMATISQAERDDFARQIQTVTSTTTQRQPGDIDTSVIGRPDKFDGDPMKNTDWFIKPRTSGINWSRR